MANRICSLCGEFYTDEQSHNYDKCVITCEQNLKRYFGEKRKLDQMIIDQSIHLEEAKRIAKSNWWRK